jgi:hypothetical protein
MKMKTKQLILVTAAASVLFYGQSTAVTFGDVLQGISDVAGAVVTGIGARQQQVQTTVDTLSQRTALVQRMEMLSGMIKSVTGSISNETAINYLNKATANMAMVKSYLSLSDDQAKTYGPMICQQLCEANAYISAISGNDILSTVAMNFTALLSETIGVLQSMGVMCTPLSMTVTPVNVTTTTGTTTSTTTGTTTSTSTAATTTSSAVAIRRR